MHFEVAWVYPYRKKVKIDEDLDLFVLRIAEFDILILLLINEHNHFQNHTYNL